MSERLTNSAPQPERGMWDKPSRRRVMLSEELSDSDQPVTERPRRKVMEGWNDYSHPIPKQETEPANPFDADIDARYGAGTADYLRETGIKPWELNQENTMMHASTGDRLPIPTTPEQKAQAESLEIAANVESLQQNGGDLVTVAAAEVDGEPVVVEAFQLDSDHGVEVTYDTNGGLKDVVVFASETDADGNTTEHSVEVTPDSTNPGSAPPVITIDGEPITTTGEAEIAEAVVAHTDKQIKELMQPAPEEAVSEQAVIDTKEAAAPASERPVRTPEAQAKIEFIGRANQYFATGRGVPEKVLQQVAGEAGVNMQDFRERLSKGEITIDPEAAEALENLTNSGFGPRSPEWNTDPRNPSALGRATGESRQLLADFLRKLAKHED